MNRSEEIQSFLKSKKYYVLFLGAILLFFLLRLILLRTPNTELTYTVKRENLVDVVQVSGTYMTASQTQVTSPTNGVIDQLFAKNNAVVQKGDPLFHVQSTATPDQQKTAYANYLAASSAVQADNANLYALQSAMYSVWKKFTDLATNSTYQNGDASPNTTNRVLPEFTTAQDNWLAAEAQFKNQQVVIAKDQAALSAAQQAYAETQSVTVTAPIAGKIANLLSQVGDQVSAPQPLVLLGNSISSSSNPVLILVGSGDAYVAADISEDYATQVLPYQKAYLVFDADKNKTITGEVASVASVGTNNQGIITYPARILMDANQPLNIKPNMTALISIETLRINNVITVPNSSVFTKDNISYVKLAGSHKLIPVELGTRGTAKTEIINGLSAGTVIVVDPNSN